MLNQPQTPPVHTQAPPAQHLDVLFRHVLQTAPGRHLLQLMLQYRQEVKE